MTKSEWDLDKELRRNIFWREKLDKLWRKKELAKDTLKGELLEKKGIDKEDEGRYR